MRIAIYVRVSTSHQVLQQTIDQQLVRLRSHVQSQGWTMPEERIFRDDGYSGATLARPGLDRLRDLVHVRELDRVVIASPDRLVREHGALPASPTSWMRSMRRGRFSRAKRPRYPRRPTEASRCCASSRLLATRR